MPVLLASFLVAAVQLAGQARAATIFGDIVIANFRDWDANSDGILSKEEINLAVRDPRFHEQPAAVLAALKEWLDFVQVPPQLTPRWFSNYRPLTFPALDPRLSQREKDAINQERAQWGPGLIGRYQTAIDRIHHGTYRLYKPSGPSLDDIRQGGLGDCWLVASLGGVVARDPAEITRMIEPTNQGYLVHYGDGTNIPVGPITDAEVALAGADLSRGLWVRVFERSWGLRKPVTINRRFKPEAVTVTLGAADSLTGKFFDAIQLGEDISKVRVSENVRKKCEEVRSRLVPMLRDHQLVYCVSGRGPQCPGIPNAHWQTVFGYDPNTDAILIWNPWGDTTRPGSVMYPRKDGFYQMPIEAFVRSFWSIVFESPDRIRLVKS